MSKTGSNRKKHIKSILIIEIIIFLVLVVFVWGYYSFTRTINKIPRDYSQDEQIVQNDDIGIDGYRNIVIFGLDTRDNTLKRGNSDTIIVASIDQKTKEVRLVSIYRDTYVNIPDIGYRKINAAYANGGYSLAINTINLNFDLDIREYVTVNFKAVVDVIDKLGGITLDIEENELKYLNGYVRELNKINGTNVPGLQSAGTQTVNGTQATAYARIRYTSGGDFKRTERQRIVLEKLFDKAKSTSLTTLTTLMDDIFPEIYTNLSNKDILNLAKDIFAYEIADQTGFPFEKDAHNYQRLSYVFPIDLKENVIRLHRFLFGKEDYSPSQKVQEYSDHIEEIRQK